ncbi:uncharacterized protein At4g15970-like isoform X1 [Nymphaea colorata]|nr:uncharacterized protein At4g15970-like isoform X1 [Nymphaea colorata]
MRGKEGEEEDENEEAEEEGTGFSIFAPLAPLYLNYKVAEMMKRPSRPPSLSSSSFGRLLMDESADRTPRTVPRRLHSVVPAFLLLALTSLLCLLVYLVSGPIEFSPRPAAGGLLGKFGIEMKENVSGLSFESFGPDHEDARIRSVFGKAATKDKTVILTTLSEAWAVPGSVFELFLESFHNGVNTHKLLDHLVVIALDSNAFARCLSIHIHCLPLVTEGIDFSGGEKFFMSHDYLKMMWRRIDFLRSVLVMGYNFVFTIEEASYQKATCSRQLGMLASPTWKLPNQKDADILWLRNPFPRFYLNADFQIACDHFLGSSLDFENRPNGGFAYVRSNNRTIAFYEFWYSSRELYPGHHDQDVLNYIKYDSFVTEIGLRIRFLNTAFFGGLCEPSKDFNKVCTMHANCCVGLSSKLHDMRIMLEDWRKFMSLPPREKRLQLSSWRVPQNCSLPSE